MEKIIKIEEATIDQIKTFNLSKKDILYSLEINNQNIGNGIIRNNDKIEVYILKEYQSQGYGTMLFKFLLKTINKEITIDLKIENIKMRKIIEKYNGVEVSRTEQIVKYAIPKLIIHNDF